MIISSKNGFQAGNPEEWLSNWRKGGKIFAEHTEHRNYPRELVIQAQLFLVDQNHEWQPWSPAVWSETPDRRSFQLHRRLVRHQRIGSRRPFRRRPRHPCSPARPRRENSLGDRILKSVFDGMKIHRLILYRVEVSTPRARLAGGGNQRTLVDAHRGSNDRGSSISNFADLRSIAFSHRTAARDFPAHVRRSFP